MNPEIVTQDVRDFGAIFIHSELDDAGLTPAEFRVYAHIARRAGSDGAYPGIDSMAEVCRLAKATVIDAVRMLESRKMIFVKREEGQRNRYHLTRQSAWQPATPVQTEERPKPLPELNTPLPDLARTSSNEGTGPVQTRERKDIHIRKSNKVIQEREPSLPSGLKTPEFLAAWSDYESYRRNAKLKKLQPRSIEAKWQEMDKWGVSEAIKGIRESIANGWQGIFRPKGANGHKPKILDKGACAIPAEQRPKPTWNPMEGDLPQ